MPSRSPSSSRAAIKAARRLLTRLLKKQGAPPKCVITDRVRSYGAARCQVMPDIEHPAHKGLSNRPIKSVAAKTRRVDAELPIVRSSQRFSSIFSTVRNLFVPSHSQRSACQIYLHRERHGRVESCDGNTRLKSTATILLT